MAYWNPYQLLDVYPTESGFTCVGTTQQGRRCRQSFLKNAHKSEADRLLGLLPAPGQFSCSYSELLPTLKHLAWLTLCPRWHQSGEKSQVDSVAAKWLRIIINSSGSLHYTHYQYPVLQILPPLSPLYTHQTIGQTVPLLPTPYVAEDPQYPPSSATRSPPRASETYTHGASTNTAHAQVSSSTETTRNGGSIRIDLNITVVLGQTELDGAHRSSGSGTSTPPRSSNRHSPNSTMSTSTRSDETSSVSVASSTSTSVSSTNRDLQAILSRLDALERQAGQILNNNRSTSSDSSGLSRSSNRTLTDPRSPVESIMSDLYLPPPGHAQLFFSPPRSPPPVPHVGSLSISTDSTPSSPLTIIGTPSFSGSFSPAIPSPAGAQATVLLGAPGRLPAPARVQRRPITAETECGICLEPIYRAADAVWCRGTCGQNVHVECFDEWRGYQNGDRLLCTYCRQPWLF